ncbi:MAG: nitrile hydratase accessory protein [Gammaproteobacteria bacterium]|nr:nitrile hydratase accessory protein [Gammaproteobacteria bacterium]
MAPSDQFACTDTEPPKPLIEHDTDVIFQEGWHAQVIALAFNLVEQGQFTNAQWSASLGDELAKAKEAGEPDNSETYYRAALAALEHLLHGQSSLSTATLDDRTEAWREAYLRTPHGQPVLL